MNSVVWVVFAVFVIVGAIVASELRRKPLVAERPRDFADRAMATTGCTCDIFDVGPRCDFCVTECWMRGHPDSPTPANGQNCYCGEVR